MALGDPVLCPMRTYRHVVSWVEEVLVEVVLEDSGWTGHSDFAGRLDTGVADPAVAEHAVEDPAAPTVDGDPMSHGGTSWRVRGD
jgi:hypothetical protein